MEARMASSPRLVLAHSNRSAKSRPFIVWREEQGGWKIEYAARVLEEIRAEAVRGLLGIGHGGLEVGGLLLGTRLGNFLRILAWRPIACQHAQGPAFVLSQRDEEVLQRQLSLLPEEAETRDLQVLGWFVSHTRRESELSGDEQQLFARYFPGEGALTLVVRPHRLGEMEVRIHMRKRELGAAEALSPEMRVESAPRVNPSTPAGRPRTAAPLPPLTIPAAVAPDSTAPGREPWLERLLPALMLLALAATAWFAWRQLPVKQMIQGPAAAVVTSSPQPLHLLSLHAGPTPSGLRLSWNAGSVWITESDHAVVEFKAGGNEPVTRTLFKDELARGRMLLELPAGAREVNFSVFGSANRLLAHERVSWRPDFVAP
jgi:proteasome lid subunit RPN8/RPN11